MNTYVFEAGTKKKIFIAFLAGVLFLGAGILFSGSGHAAGSKAETETTEVSKEENHEAATVVTHEEKEVEAPAHHEEEEVVVTTGTKVLANFYPLLYMGFFISLAAIFILCAATVAWGGWQIQIQKITVSISQNVFVYLGLLGVSFLLFGKKLFIWLNEELYVKGGPHYDAALDLKHDYLNPTRFGAFYVLLSLMAGGLGYAWWRNLKAQDERPSLKLFSQSRMIGAIGIVLIAFLIDTFATWDWSMSVQPHWYSTMFPWYTMASAAVTTFSITLLIILHLKGRGLLPNVNENHIHDVAKLMFAITVFWTYVFFDQYMLIWYGNIPEETSFFINRRQFDNYGFLFHITFIVNFVLPFLILMKRNSKRSVNVTRFIAIVIIIGHWMDFYLMIGPALVPKGGFGLISVGALLIVGSLFTYVTLWRLSCVKDLSSTTHPYYKESLQHQI